MRSPEPDVDLALVTTYVPVFLVFVRALGLLGVHHVLVVLEVSPPVMFCTMAFYVFVDHYALVYDTRFDAACGQLFPVAMCLIVYITPALPCIFSRSATNWSVDMVWASSATLQTAAAAFGVVPAVASRYPLLKACFWGACGIAHASVACGSRSLLEWVARFAAYYGLCAQVYFSKEVLPGVDRSKHVFLTPHLCVHALFTHAYITISTVCIFTCIHSYVFFAGHRPLDLQGKSNKQVRADELTDVFETGFEPRDDSKDDESVLLRQLRNAQASKMV